MQHRNSLAGGREQARSARSATDAALVKLVLAGAPARWLWVEPEVSGLEGAPDWQALEQAIRADRRDMARGIGRQVQPGFRESRASEVWRELRRLWRRLVQRWTA